MRVNRARLGVAAALTVIGSLLPISAAAAAPAAPVISAITTLSSGRITTSPGAGTTNAPVVEVTGVTQGQRVYLTYTGATEEKVCDVPVAATVVKFNDLTVCPLSQFVVGGDGVYVFSATVADGPLPTAERSAASNLFDYIRDNDIPAPPRGADWVEDTNVPGTVGTTKLAGADVTITFLASLGDQQGPVGSGVARYQILRDDTTEGDTGGFILLGTTVPSSSCPTASSTPCTFTDTTSEDGHTYIYAVRAEDLAGNESGDGDNLNPVSDPVTADGSGPTAPAAPTVTSGLNGALAGYGTDDTPKIAVTNSSGEDATVQLYKKVVGSSDAPVAFGSVETVANGVTVDWNNDTPTTDTDVANLGTDGAYEITAKLIDSLGNVGPASAATTYTLDRVSPAAPTIDSINGQTTDATAGNDTTPAVVIGGVANGDRVSLNVNDANASPPAETVPKTAAGTTLTYNDGETPDFTLTGGERTVSFTATVVDGAGNSSSPSATKTYVFDATAPAAPAIASMEGDTSSPAVDRDRTPRTVVTVTTDTARVEIWEGDTELGEKANTGATSVTLNDLETDTDFAVTYGVHSLVAKAFDAAGNSASSPAFSYEAVDNAPPSTPSPTAKVISGTPGRVWVDWADSTDPNAEDGQPSNPVTYTVTRAVTPAGTGGSCPAASGLTFTQVATGLTTSQYVDSATTATQCHYYKVVAVDSVGNASPASNSTTAVKPAASNNPDAPTITSVNDDTSSPAFGKGAGSATPAVIVTVGEPGGTLELLADGAVVASKAVAASPVTFGASDFTTPIAPREHVLTARQRVGELTSAASGSFDYRRAPDAPTFSSVAGDTNGSPAKDDDTKPAVNLTGVQNNDLVILYVDDGEETREVARKTATTTSVSFIITDWQEELAMGVYDLTATTCDPGIGACATVDEATSLPTAPYVYERAPIVQGYVVDGFGGLHPVGGAPAVTDGPYWPGWDIARDVVVRSDGVSGYVLDGYGGLSPFGGAPVIPDRPWFPGHDIAKDVILISDSAGYVIDGFAGIHPFGGAPRLVGGPWFPGFDIIRSITQVDVGQFLLLDGWGGIHTLHEEEFAAPFSPKDGPWFPGHDVAQEIVSPCCSTGYVIDGFGAVQSFGEAPDVEITYWRQFEPFVVGGVLTEVSEAGGGGYTLDNRGGLHAYGGALALPRPATFSFDIARALDVVIS